MSEETKNPVQRDWEMEDEFYGQEQGQKTLSLEDFMEEESGGSLTGQKTTPDLEEAAVTIRQILSLAAEGRKTGEIAEELGLTFDYVSQAQICAQSFPEDDALAIARLLIMG